MNKDSNTKITLSSAVIQDLESHFSEHEMQDIRIYLAPDKNGQRLGIVLDKAEDTDEISVVSGYRFCYSRGLVEKCGEIHIKLDEMGYVFETSKPLTIKSSSCSPSNCNSCSSTCKL